MNLPDPSTTGAAPAFGLTLGRDGARAAVEVVSFRGVEELSRPYRFDVVVALPRGASALEVADVLGEPARLTLATPSDGDRVVHGVVEALRRVATDDGDAPRYRLRLAPRLALLRHTLDSRVFQDLTAPEIVRAVLDRAGVAHRWSLLGSYAVRGYCVQHQESDLAFVARLLAEEGIWYAFEHAPDADGEVALFADREAHYAPIAGDPELLLSTLAEADAAEHVSRFELERSVRAGATQLQRYDFRQPAVGVSASASVDRPARGFDEGTLRAYDHHAEFDEGALARSDARRALAQRRRRAVQGGGESACRRLAPGLYFALLDGSSESLEGEYAVTRVEHRARPRRVDASGAGGAVGPVYANRFGCVRRADNHPPARPARRIQQGLETATVVGPAGEEIYTDALGRVKVQFHWDREGARDERSSCWLRLVQGWGGAQHGMQFIPRVGSEVVVGFMGGDTDRPVVLGSVYNGAHGPPFDLPATRTRGGFRTASTPGGDGHNELSFEDAAGAEEVFLRAQRDLREEVLRDRTTDVGANLTVSVGVDWVETVGGERVEVVRGGRTSTVMGSAAAHVLGDARSAVDGEVFESFNAGAARVVAGDLTTRVGGVDERHVRGAQRVAVAGDQSTRVEGCATLQVGRGDEPGTYAVHVEGFAQLAGTRAASLGSDEEVVLRCGRSSIRVTPDQIELVSPTVLFTAEGAAGALGGDRVRFRAVDRATVVADAVTLRTAGASLGLDSEARLGGAKVRLGARDDSDDLSPGEAPTPTRIELVDQDGAPLAYQRFTLVLPDGTTRAGVLDRDGAAMVDLDGPAEVVFDELQEVREA